jgi:CRP/FNR family transcriptional regulator, cyclic AMP receptor protein
LRLDTDKLVDQWICNRAFAGERMCEKGWKAIDYRKECDMGIGFELGAASRGGSGGPAANAEFLAGYTRAQPAELMSKAVTRAGIFHRLEPSVVAAVAQRLSSAHYQPGQRIFTQGEPGERLYIIESGKVKIAHKAPDGREYLQAVLGPSDLFGELDVFDPGPRNTGATAVTEVRAMFTDRAALCGWIADHPEIAEQLLRVMARRVRRRMDYQVELIYTDVPGRVAKQLLQLAQQFGCQDDGAVHVAHDLTQEEIAQLTGASRETVNKALSDFAGRGWIQLRDKSVLILDSERLMRQTR